MRSNIENTNLYCWSYGVLKIIVLVPLILSLLWFGYLKTNGYTLSQGKQGFTYILVLSSVIALFYTLMLFLTH